MRAHEVEQARMNRGPDRMAHRPLRRRSAWDLLWFPDLRHVLDRHLDAQLELLLRRRVDDRDGAVLGPGWALRAELVMDGLFHCELTHFAFGI